MNNQSEHKLRIQLDNVLLGPKRGIVTESTLNFYILNTYPLMGLDFCSSVCYTYVYI